MKIMAGRPKLPLNEENVDRLLEVTKELLLKHSSETHDIIEERETRKGSVHITYNVDCSEATPTFEVHMSVPRKPVKDGTNLEGEQEGQQRFDEIDGQVDASVKVKGAPKSKKVSRKVKVEESEPPTVKAGE